MRYNKPFLHLLKHQQKYLTILAAVVLIFPLLLNYTQGDPLLKGAESYIIIDKLPGYLSGMAAVLPLLLGLSSLLLLFNMAREMKMGETFLFFWMFFLILSPAFISTFSTMSGYAFFIFFSLAGVFLLLKPKFQYVSLIPFIFATFIDGFSTLLLAFAMAVYYFQFRKKKWHLAIPIILLLMLIINQFFDQSFFWGPFHYQQLLSDLISDLGGISGISLFVIILAVIGISLTWKRKTDSIAYLFIVPLLPAYFLSTQTIFLAAIVTAFFAARGFIFTFERDWAVPMLKNFTLFLLLISIAFSSVTYIQRNSFNGPFAEEREALAWIRENTGGEDIVFSIPENGPYIRHFAVRHPVFSIEKDDALKQKEAETILNSTYTATTFPILERYDIRVIYITPQMREKYPPEQGLLFLLKNEKFKLEYAYEGYEIWSFKP